MAEAEKKEEIKINPQELKDLKSLYTAIRIAELNLQAAGLGYQQECLKLAKNYGVVDELYDIDRLTGVIKIKPGALPGVGGGPQGR